MSIDVREHNRIAWDTLADRGDPWTVPVSPEAIAEAREGRWEIVLTPNKPVPRAWLDVAGKQVLCLASGGGQQSPILAAAGARVTVLDNSPKQLERDARTAEQHGLAITTVRGDMANLEMFPDASFDVVVHPVSNCFVPDVLPVWREAFRVLRPGGTLLSGFANPAMYVFDLDLADRAGRLEVKSSLPYSDGPRAADEPARVQPYARNADRRSDRGRVAITGMYEDFHMGGDSNILNKYMPTFIATRALKVA